MRRGLSLIEVTVSMCAFTAVLVVGFTVMVLGSRTWSTVQSKADAQRDARIAIGDISKELSRAIGTTVGFSTANANYRWALWFQTAMNDTNNPKQLGGTTMSQQDAGGNPVPQRYVLYYVARMDCAEHTSRYGYLCSSYPSGTGLPDPSSGPDVTCPHKWLIKKEIYLLNGANHDQTDNIGLQGAPNTVINLDGFLNDASRTEIGLANEGDATTPGSQVHTARVLAQNVLSFEVARVSLPPGLNTAPVANTAGPIVLVHLRLFKVDEVAKTHTLGQAPGVLNAASSGVPPLEMVPLTLVQPRQLDVTSTVDPSLAPYVIDVSTQGVPLN